MRFAERLKTSDPFIDGIRVKPPVKDAFTCFLQSEKQNIKEKLADLAMPCTASDVKKTATAKWDKMSEKKKAEFLKRANDDKERYERDLGRAEWVENFEKVEKLREKESQAVLKKAEKEAAAKIKEAEKEAAAKLKEATKKIEAMQKKQAKEVAAAKKKAEKEAAAAAKKAEAAKQKEEAAAKKKAEKEAAAAAKKAEAAKQKEEAAAKKKAEKEAAAAAKKAEAAKQKEEAAAKKKAEAAKQKEEAAAKKKAEKEAAAAAKKAEAAKQKEEAAAKKKAEKEAAAAAKKAAAPKIPSDAALTRAIHEFVRKADLDVVTHKQIRERMEHKFSVGLSTKNDAIKAAIRKSLRILEEKSTVEAKVNPPEAAAKKKAEKKAAAASKKAEAAGKKKAEKEAETQKRRNGERPKIAQVKNGDRALSSRIQDVSQELKLSHFLLPICGLKDQPLVSLKEAVSGLDIAGVQALAQQAVDAINYKQEMGHEDKRKLTVDEAASLHLYSQESLFYSELNASLRNADRGRSQRFFPYLKLFFTAVEKLQNKRMTVYRGISGKDLGKGLKQGQKLTWWGVSSCTKSSHVLNCEQFLGQTGKRTLFAIACQKAVSIKEYSALPAEDEFILRPGTVLQVEGVLDLGGGKDAVKMVQMKEVSLKTPPFPYK